MNQDKSKVYSPNGNYRGKPPQYKIGEITAQITGQDGNPMQITAQGLTIWGTALSKDDNYIKAVMANKAEEVCNIIKKVITPFNLLSPDVAMTVLRFSLQQRLQYFQQTHKPIHIEEINTKVQQALDSALDQVTGLKLFKSETYAINPESLKDPTLGPEMVAQPARHKGLGIRKVDGFVGHAAFVRGIDIIVRRLIDHIAEDGSKVPGLYPLLEDVFGEGSQDYGNAENRFVKFIDGSSTLGEHFLHSIRVLKTQCPGAEDGPLSMPEHEIRPVNNNDP